MVSQKPVQRIAIVGTGTIGASWATHYLAQGFDVTATDPAPGAEAALRSYVEGAWDGGNQAGTCARRLPGSAEVHLATCGRPLPTPTSFRRTRRSARS